MRQYIECKHRLSIPLVTILGLGCLTSASAADCSRADIAFYLEQGFTPSQITEICTTQNEVSRSDAASTVRQEHLPNEKIDVVTKANPSVAESRPNSVSEDDSEFLADAVLAHDIQFYDDKLVYVSDECIEFEPTPSPLITAKRFCGVIRTTVHYDGLAVVQTKKKIFGIFGARFVAITGDINQEIVDPNEANHLASFDRHLLDKAVEGSQQARIPIRNEASLERAKAELEQLSKGDT